MRKPPRVILWRMLREMRAELDRFITHPQWQSATEGPLRRAIKKQGIDHVWADLADRPYPAFTPRPSEPAIETLCPEDRRQILARAEDALAHRVNLLGSGPLQLGENIDWHRDYKTGHSWPDAYSLRLNYDDPKSADDVKVPWEISRLQWLIPAGQAYLLTRDERYARGVRSVLEDWIAGNPYARGVNWACTMEVALRVISWTWFFHVFKDSPSWRVPHFQESFLSALYRHGKFTERYLERSDINGNHYTANAAGLVYAGLFFGSIGPAESWQRHGWAILADELPRQVLSDGVDFESSTAYHRLVLELFLLPALYRQAQGLAINAEYRERVIQMARFTRAYTRPTGDAPLWGDADDARALPLGAQPLNDHRYLLGLVGSVWNVAELRDAAAGPHDEVFWLLGPEACAQLPQRDCTAPCASQAFSEAGVYVLRNERDHIFIDCGPVGMAGRGGHGHNDCLSFEAMLNGTQLISDCGAYLYTASYDERNLFRSTQCHNTPCVNRQEINRLVRWDYLWTLQNDAQPQMRRWQPGAVRDVFQGAHTGYQRLETPITPVRTIVLDHESHGLALFDEFESPVHTQIDVEIPLQLAPGVQVEPLGHNSWRLTSGETFVLAWEGQTDWQATVEPGRISPSYGVTVPAWRLVWRYRGTSQTSLMIGLLPESTLVDNPIDWAQRTLEAAGAPASQLPEMAATECAR